MRYITLLFLIASCAATTALSMDVEQKTLTLKRQFATISWLQNAHEIKVTGLSAPLQSETIPTELQQAFLAILDAPSFEFPYKEAITPIVCINVQKLAPLFQVMEQLRRDELMAELVKKYRKAQSEYLPLRAAMNLFPMEYRTSENESRLDSLKQNVERCAAQLAVHNTNWRTHYNCPELRDRASKKPTMQEIAAEKRTLAAKFPDPGFSFPF